MDDHHPHRQSMATPAAASMCGSKSKKLQGGGERSSRGSGAGNSPPAMRKGPWTEEEDAQLVWFVRLFGERRWDFLAKVSGLRRTGKSCRLRWVNYLHPGLRRGRITADEERLILQLHEQWGSRWSRIARSLPGRTDNEIKNFWRTRTRKQKAAAQQQNSRSSKTASASAFSGSSSSVTATTSSCSGSPSPSNGGCGTATSSSAVTESALRQSSGSGSGDDDAEFDEASTTTAASQHQHHHQQQQQQQECYASDHFWNDIAAAEAASYMLIDGWAGAGPGHPAEPPSSPAWEYYSLWRIDDDEYYKKMLDSS